MNLGQNLVADNRGVIYDGALSYQLNTKTGIMTYSGQVRAGYSIFGSFVGYTLNLNPENKPVKIDPKLLLSKEQKAGKQVPFGLFAIEVTKVEGTDITADIVINTPEAKLQGVALIDGSKEYISIEVIHVVGKAKGYDIDLNIHP